MPNDQISQFTGFIPVQPTPTDFIFGTESGILGIARNDSGDWRPELPEFKWQLMRDSNGTSHGDSNACVSFSGTNDVSVQLEWLIAHGQIDPNGLNFLKSNGYIDENSKVNLAPRFTAKMSGTDPARGNSLPTVWNSMRHDGVVPESLWPMPAAQFNGAASTQDAWNIYYEAIPQNAIDLGRQFAAWFDIQYEWIAYIGAEKTIDEMATLLNVAPLHIATAVCNGWNTENPIIACGDGAQHATTLLHVEKDVAYDILDHYNPFLKRFAADYSISFAMRGVVASKPQNPVPQAPFTHDYQVNLALGAIASSDVKALQQGLQTLKDKAGTPYMKPGVFGPFGPQTESAVGRFQVDHGIPDAPQGHDFGPKTRTALTQALADNARQLSGEPDPRPLHPDASRPN